MTIRSARAILLAALIAACPAHAREPSAHEVMDVVTAKVNERLLVKSFYDDLQHWYLLVKALAGPRPR